MRSLDLGRRLEMLRVLLGAADFGQALAVVQNDLPRWNLEHGNDPEQERVSLSVRATASEVLDYFGRYKEASDLVEQEGSRCYDLLKALDRGRIPGPSTPLDRRVLKQRVLMGIRLGYIYYRRSEYHVALRIFRVCLRVAQTFIDSEGYHPYGTIARAYCSIGLAEQELYDHESAKENFAESVHYAWMARRDYSIRGRHLSERTVDPNPLTAMTDFHISAALLGLANVHSSEGSPAVALPLLVAAGQLLAETKDRIMQSYVSVIYASVRLSEKGDNPAELADAIHILSVAQLEFADHRPYKLRATCELARAYLQLARNATDPTGHRAALDKAARHIREVQEIAEQIEDIAFNCTGLVLESRVLRATGDPIRAESLANRALELGSDRTYVVVEALTARGEARFDVGNLKEAVRDFSSALREGSKNPIFAATCHLHLARTYVRLKDLKRVREHMDAWKDVKPRVTNAFLVWLEAETERETAELTEDFVIRKTDHQLSPAILERQLHAFLVDWAQAQTDTDEEAAKLLKISKQTLYNWRARPGRLR